MSYGSLNTYHGNLNFSGQVGLGLKKETRPYIGYTVSASWYGSMGISEADRRPRTVPDNTPLEDDEADRQSYRLAVEGKFFSNQLHVRSSFYHNRMNYDFDAAAFADAPDTYANFEYSVLNNIINYQPTSRWKVTLKHSFQHMSRFFDLNLPGILPPTAYLGTFNFFDLFTRYDVNDRLGFLVGLDYRIFRDGTRKYITDEASTGGTNTSNLRTFSSFQSQVSRTELDYEVFSMQVEPYAVLYAKPFGDKFPLQMELGARVLAYPSYTDTDIYPFSFLGGSEGGVPSGQLISMDFNPFFVFKDKYKLYFSYATAYTLPTGFQLANELSEEQVTFGGEGGTLTVQNELGPEYTHSLSLGFDKAPPSLEEQKDFYISWRFASFYNITNRVIHWKSTFTPDGMFLGGGYLNGGRILQVGIEAGPSFYFGPSWQLNMGYTLLRSVILDAPSFGKDEEPYQVPGIPIHRLRGALIWKPKSPSLYLRLQSQLVGQRSGRIGGGFDLPDPSSPTGFIYVSDNLPLYVLVDFYAAYEMNIKKRYNLRFFAEAQNLLNNRNYREVLGYSTLGIQVRGGIRASL